MIMIGMISVYMRSLFVIDASAVNSAHPFVHRDRRLERHDSVPTAIQVLQNQSVSDGGSFNVRFDTIEDRTPFTDVLDASGKTALRNYLDKDGNFIAVHSASDALRNGSWFGEEVGAFFDYHPVLQNATVDVLDLSHPNTSILPAEWHVQGEMFKSDQRSVVAVVILSANELSYVGKSSDFFVAWYQERGAGVEECGFTGRSFYTSLGHLNETWMRSPLVIFFYPGADELFIAHAMGGVTWALESNTTKAFNSSVLVGNPGNDTSNPSGSSTASNSVAGPASTSSDISLQNCIYDNPHAETMVFIVVSLNK
ncbi:hypothetical protein ACEPAH_8126 [Sanghuangporus vaninii]